jgi:quercetin dioxygenase-like cupin family protein
MSIVIRPSKMLRLPGPFEVTITIRGAQTGGVMSAIEETVPPRALIGPHTHANDVWVYVLHGRVGVLVGDDEGEAGPGEWALKPRDVVHAMWNPTDEPARIIEVLTPAGSEEWFEEMAGSPPSDAEAFTHLAAKYGIRFLPDPALTDLLRQRHGLADG